MINRDTNKFHICEGQRTYAPKRVSKSDTSMYHHPHHNSSKFFKEVNYPVKKTYTGNKFLINKISKKI